MNWLKTAKNRVSIFLSSFVLTRGLIRLLRTIQQKKASRRVINHAGLSDEIFGIIASLGLNIFPFYGTLLFLIREGSITFADDFDFATFDTIDVDQLVESMRQKGAFPNGIVLDSLGKVYQLNFIYKNCSIDLAFIKKDEKNFVHEFVNFRNEIAKVTYGKNFILKKYNQIYRLHLPKFTLKKSLSLNTFIPSESETILSIIYGEDWRTPKASSFVDYVNYFFEERKVMVISGNIDDHLPKYINE